jgi:hypothetical protein
LTLSIVNDQMATMTKFVNHRKKLLKNYKLHSKLYKLNLKDTMASCLKIKIKIEWWINEIQFTYIKKTLYSILENLIWTLMHGGHQKPKTRWKEVTTIKKSKKFT